MASDPYILSVGAIKRRKGYHVLIPAYALVKKDFPDLRYVIVGNPNQSIEYFQSLEIPEGVEIVSDASRDRIDELYENAELFILAPEEVGGDIEGFGLVFLEAASHRLPIVATRSGGVADAVRDGENAILVSPGDSVGLAEAVGRVLRDRDLRDKMTAASGKFAEKMRWSAQIMRYMEVYASIQS